MKRYDFKLEKVLKFQGARYGNEGCISVCDTYALKKRLAKGVRKCVCNIYRLKGF